MITSRILWSQSLALTQAGLKSRYRKTFAGFIWVLLNPIILFGVQALVFKKFLRLELTNYYLFLASALIPWVFMVQTIQMGTGTLVAQASLLRSFKIHPLVPINASVIDNFFNFCVSFLFILLPITLLADKTPWVGLLWTPVCMIPYFIGVYALTTFLSLVNVFYRDTTFVMGFAFSVIFFITPVFYPVEFVPQQFQWLIDFNPFYHFLAPLRAALYDPAPFAWFMPWLKSWVWAIFFSGVSIWYWERKKHGIYASL